jgi:hypothetical protein
MTSRDSRDADIALRKNPEVNISKRQNKLSDTERLSFDIRLNFILICLAFVSPFVLANTKTRNSGGGETSERRGLRQFRGRQREQRLWERLQGGQGRH